MSRIGRLPIKIEDNIKVEIKERKIITEGPKGKLEYNIPSGIKVEKKENNLFVQKTRNSEKTKRLHGLVRSLISNMVQGVTEGFTKELEIKGVGYRAKIEGDDLILNLGFSHPVKITPPKDIEVKIHKNIITISGIDKQQVGEMAAKIRGIKKPEPYKGKGIRYKDEQVKKKAGKVAKAIST